LIRTDLYPSDIKLSYPDIAQGCGYTAVAGLCKSLGSEPRLDGQFVVLSQRHPRVLVSTQELVLEVTGHCQVCGEMLG